MIIPFNHHVSWDLSPFSYQFSYGFHHGHHQAAHAQLFANFRHARLSLHGQQGVLNLRAQSRTVRLTAAPRCLGGKNISKKGLFTHMLTEN
jgi:hypothetical protein